jgi:hypothetical protein
MERGRSLLSGNNVLELFDGLSYVILNIIHRHHPDFWEGCRGAICITTYPERTRFYIRDRFLYIDSIRRDVLLR